MSSKRDDKGKGKYRKPYTPNACVKFSDCGYTCIEAIKFVWHNIGLKDHTKKRKASRDKCDESRYMILGGTPFSSQRERILRDGIRPDRKNSRRPRTERR